MPFKKGDPRINRKGAPKKEFSLTTAMRDFLNEEDPETKNVRKWDLVEATYKSALKGDQASRKLLWNYVEGMPKQEVEANGDLNINLIDFKEVGWNKDETD